MSPKQKSLAPAELRFAVIATDIVVFTLHDGTLYVRMILVDRPPHYVNMWAFPGGLIHPEETAEEAAMRLVEEKGLLDPRHLHTEQLYTFSDVDRDPRGRVVAVSYLGLVPWESLSQSEQSDTDEVRWVPVTRAARLAYDHTEMLKIGTDRLRSRMTYTTLLSKLMPDEFTLTELEQSYESVLKTNLDKRNFRKKVLKLNMLKPVGRKRSLGRARPAELYSFASSKVKEIGMF